jgi:hypothetical protein
VFEVEIQPVIVRKVRQAEGDISYKWTSISFDKDEFDEI